MYGIRGMGIIAEYNSNKQSGMGLGGEEYIRELAISQNRVNHSLYTFTEVGTVRAYNLRTQEQTNYLSLGHIIR